MKNPEVPIEAFEIYATGIDHPECLAFEQNGVLWAGGEAGQIYRIGPDRKVEVICEMKGFCAGLAFSPEDELFVCNAQHGIMRVKRDGAFSVFATDAGTHKLVSPNYGLFDSAGNYYVTDSGQFRKRNGYLARFAPDGRGQILAGPCGYANGLALSADEKEIFMVESDTDSVLRFRLGAGGKVSKPEMFAAECGRFPDGLTLDAEGNLYVCCYASDEIWRIAPSGEKTLFAWDRWGILLGSPTNMAFGGDNFDEMYVANLARTTIARGRINRKGQPLANQRSQRQAHEIDK